MVSSAKQKQSVIYLEIYAATICPYSTAVYNSRSFARADYKKMTGRLKPWAELVLVCDIVRF